MIGIICPSEFEAKALDREAIGPRAALIISGMGKIRAVCACARLMATVQPLDGILLVGFAGALTNNLRVGDVIEPQTFIEYDYNAEPFEPFPHILRKRPQRRLLRASRPAVMLTQDRFLTSNPYGRGPDAVRYRTLACDMESYAVAYYCEQARVPYAVVKLISDVADAQADHDFLAACTRLAPELNRLTVEASERFQKSRAARATKQGMARRR